MKISSRIQKKNLTKIIENTVLIKVHQNIETTDITRVLHATIPQEVTEKAVTQRMISARLNTPVAAALTKKIVIQRSVAMARLRTQNATDMIEIEEEKIVQVQFHPRTVQVHAIRVVNEVKVSIVNPVADTDMGLKKEVIVIVEIIIMDMVRLPEETLQKMVD